MKYLSSPCPYLYSNATRQFLSRLPLFYVYDPMYACLIPTAFFFLSSSLILLDYEVKRCAYPNFDRAVSLTGHVPASIGKRILFFHTELGLFLLYANRQTDPKLDPKCAAIAFIGSDNGGGTEKTMRRGANYIPMPTLHNT